MNTTDMDFNFLFKGDDLFKDGVINHNSEHKLSSDGKHLCCKATGDEVEQFLKQLFRAIFIGKDTPDNEIYDLREQSLRKDTKGSKTVRTALLKNCVRWFYASWRLIVEKKETPFDSGDTFLNTARTYWEKHYVARINMKKDIGNKTCSEYKMHKYLESEANLNLLKKQLRMLNPNFIVLMDGDWEIGREILMNKIWNDEKWNKACKDEQGTWIWYSGNRMIIQVYHPSNTHMTDETKYRMLVDRLQDFVKKYNNIVNKIFNNQ